MERDRRLEHHVPLKAWGAAGRDPTSKMKAAVDQMGCPKAGSWRRTSWLYWQAHRDPRVQFRAFDGTAAAVQPPISSAQPRADNVVGKYPDQISLLPHDAPCALTRVPTVCQPALPCYRRTVAIKRVTPRSCSSGSTITAVRMLGSSCCQTRVDHKLLSERGSAPSSSSQAESEGSASCGRHSATSALSGGASGYSWLRSLFVNASRFSCWRPSCL